ncbi:hypothetical protein NB689_003120 [Xanthomonas sacchari]|nr:hypothetical protein [Xanthomonas sacchari]
MLFHLGQRQQLVDGLGEALLLLGDVAHEALPLRFRQRLLQQFRRAADRGQRALHLVGQRLHVLLDVLLALQLAAHGLQGTAEIADLVAARRRRRHRRTGTDRLRIAVEPADAAQQAPGHQDPDQRRDADQPGAAQQDAALAGDDERLDAAVGLGQGQHADQPLRVGRIVDRRGHVHHRVIGVAVGLGTGAGAVLAAQGAVHVVPARVVAADVLSARIEHHDARRIGEGDAVVDAVLGKTPDHRARIAPLRRGQVAGETAAGDAPVLEILRGHLRQHVGRVHQGRFHRLAHARLDLVDEHPHHEEGGHADDQEEAQEQLQPQPHLRPPARSRGRGGCGSDRRWRRPRAAWRAGS